MFGSRRWSHSPACVVMGTVISAPEATIGITMPIGRRAAGHTAYRTSSRAASGTAASTRCTSRMCAGNPRITVGPIGRPLAWLEAECQQANGAYARAVHFGACDEPGRRFFSLQVAQAIFSAPVSVGVASGIAFPDALSGGSYRGAHRWPDLLDRPRPRRRRRPRRIPPARRRARRRTCSVAPVRSRPLSKHRRNGARADRLRTARSSCRPWLRGRMSPGSHCRP